MPSRRPGANLGQPNQLATLLLFSLASLVLLSESHRIGRVTAALDCCNRACGTFDDRIQNRHVGSCGAGCLEYGYAVPHQNAVAGMGVSNLGIIFCWGHEIVAYVSTFSAGGEMGHSCIDLH